MNSGAHNAIFSDENPFWQYSLQQYARPGCSAFLLQAQNQLNLNVNHLLFMGFSATQGRMVAPSIHPVIEEWHMEKVERIRAVRLRCKNLNNQKFYEALKSLELYSEWFEQKLFFALQATALNDDCFEECVKESLLFHLKKQGGEVDEAWLQALIEHLQPQVE